MDEFTDEQVEYLESDINKHVFLEACPGSGKTEVVAAKVAKEVSSWNMSHGGIAVLSFANSATNELKARIARNLPSNNSYFPHFIGTFDSFIYKNIVSPLATKLTGFQGNEGDCSIRIVENNSTLGFRTKYGIAKKGSIYGHHFEFDLKNDKIYFNSGINALDNMLNAAKLESWQIADLVATKKRMFSAGYATYRDIEYLAFKAFIEDDTKIFIDLLSKKYPLIIIDECQDLSFEQLLILQKLLDLGVKLHFIGDLHQAIYGFRDVEPEEVKGFVRRNDFTCLQLTRNFRSCQKVINLCGELTGRNEIIGQLTQLEPVCYIIQYKDCVTEVMTAFEELSQDYENCVIVARGHSTLQKFHTSATSLKPIHKLALAIKIFDSENMELLERALLLFSEFIRVNLDESVKPNSFSCPESVESKLKWRQFLYLSISYFIKNGAKDTNQNWTSWVKAIKPLINELSSNSFVSESIELAISPLSIKDFRAPSGQSKHIVVDTLGHFTDTSSNYRKATIHGVKGETHDVTMLVSTAKRTGQAGSHWKDWLKNHEEESARMAYVASSRPKYRLIWAVKKLSTEESKELTSIGFEFIN